MMKVFKSPLTKRHRVMQMFYFLKKDKKKFKVVSFVEI